MRFATRLKSVAPLAVSEGRIRAFGVSRGLLVVGAIAVLIAAALLIRSLSGLRDSTRASADLAEIKTFALDVALTAEEARGQEDATVLEATINEAEEQAAEITQFAVEVLGDEEGEDLIADVKTAWFIAADAARGYVTGDTPWTVVVTTAKTTGDEVDAALEVLAARRESGTSTLRNILWAGFGAVGVGALLVGLGFWRARRQARSAERRNLEQSERITDLLECDLLTGLPNGVVFRSRLGGLLEGMNADSGGRVWVATLDLDRFGRVNDAYGFDAGDELLRAVAGRLDACSLPREITVARQGADQFFFCWDDAEPVSGERFARELIQSLDRPFSSRGEEILLSASVGLSIAPGDGTEAETLIRNAEIALDSVRRDGGSDVGFYEADERDEAPGRLSLEVAMRRALELDEFVLHYQPVVDLQTGDTVGAEALIRWQSRTQGLVAPDSFIPSLEETGLIVPVGAWALAEACGQAKAWEGVLPGFKMAVNVSARQLAHPELAGSIVAALEASELSPSALVIEVTETAALRNQRVATEVLTCLREHGVGVALDDFGTGQSSLEHVRELPADSLKIDRSFISDLPANRQNSAIAASLVGLAHSLGWTVVAEGIETDAQRNLLRDLGCDLAQGYFFSKPVAAEAFGDLLRREQLDSRAA